jgi:hypothetical protein
MGWWVAALGIALILYLVAVALTVWLARHVWKRRKRVSAMTKVFMVLLIGAIAYGSAGGALGVLKGFAAQGGESVDPAQKARVLGEGIAEVMNCCAFAIAVWLPSFAVAFVLFRRSRRAAV